MSLEELAEFLKQPENFVKLEKFAESYCDCCSSGACRPES